MKKVLTLIAGLVIGSAAYAMPVLNPAEPALLTRGTFLCDDGDCWGIKFGYRGDFVYNRHLKNIDVFSLWANEGVLTLNLWDRVDIYGMVGAVSFDEKTVVTSHTVDNELILHSKARTIWGVGAKAVLWETCWGNCGTTYIGLSADYESTSTVPWDYDTINGDIPTTFTGRNPSYHETQIALGLSHRICFFVPYIAVTWSNAGTSSSNYAYISEDNSALLGGRNSNRHWGYVIGTTLVDAGRMDVTAEARFVDEKALSVAANIKF